MKLNTIRRKGTRLKDFVEIYTLLEELKQFTL